MIINPNFSLYAAVFGNLIFKLYIIPSYLEQVSFMLIFSRGMGSRV